MTQKVTASPVGFDLSALSPSGAPEVSTVDTLAAQDQTLQQLVERIQSFMNQQQEAADRSSDLPSETPGSADDLSQLGFLLGAVTLLQTLPARAQAEVTRIRTAYEAARAQDPLSAETQELVASYQAAQETSSLIDRLITALTPNPAS